MNLDTEISHLSKQLECLKAAMYAIAPSQLGHSELTSVIGPMLPLMHTSGESIKLLAEAKHFRSVIIMSRPLIEEVINLGFICLNGDDGAIKAKKYAYQKGYRDLFREYNGTGFEIKNGIAVHKNVIDTHRPQNLVDALAEYTTKKGHEVNNWTNETTKEKVEAIGVKYGTLVNGLLSFAFFNVYRDVSEIIHGSYYGVLIYIGMQQRSISSFSSAEEAAEFFGDHQKKLTTMMIQQVSIAVHCCIDILSQTFSMSSALTHVKDDSYSLLIQYADKASAENI